MTATRTYPFFMRMAAACVTVCGVMASEYHGTVTTSGLPVPGATVTAAQPDKKVVTTTDDRGQFTFAELADGTWTLEVDMLGFAKVTREVGVAHDAPPPQFSLKILSETELLVTLEPSQPLPAIVPAAPRSSPGGARPASPPQAAFQRISVSQSASTSAITNEGAIKSEEITDLNQSAANSFIVQGSLSSAAGLPQQNDWGFGGRGMGPAWALPQWAALVATVRAALPRWLVAERKGVRAAAWELVEAVEDSVEVPAAVDRAADPAVQAVPQWGADPEWEAVAADAADPTGRGVRMPWHSATAGATRAPITTATRPSAWITPYGMRARSRSLAPP